MVEMTWPALDAVDHGPGHEPRQQRVLGEIFEVPAAPWVANKIGRASEQHIEAFGSRLFADHRSLPPRNAQVPSRGERQIGRHRCRLIARADVSRIRNAEFGVGLLQRRYSEPRNSVRRNPPIPPIPAVWVCRPTARREHRGRADSFSAWVMRPSTASARCWAVQFVSLSSLRPRPPLTQGQRPRRRAGPGKPSVSRGAAS